MRISPVEFNESGLRDWRFLLGSIEAHFTFTSYPAAAGFVTQISILAEAANHHPDLDLRHPAEVLVRTTTHSVGSITQQDLDLARQVSDLARELGAEATLKQSPRVEVAIDAFDIEAIRPFWLAALGYRDQSGDLVDPLGQGPSFWFQQMEELRLNRNTIHLDITVNHDIAEQRVADVIAAGGTLTSQERARSWWVLTDAEGNEACICTWQDR